MNSISDQLHNVNPDFWRGRRVLLTGHTGFKGSWLSLWLQSMGADLHGLSLEPPTTPALYEIARVGARMTSHTGDIREFQIVQQVMQASRPEIVLHLAAQPLVRYSYAAPIETYATNVMGTVHVLEAARQIGSVRAVVNVTTDKCYENTERLQGYREDEPMGGHDPYSNSKGCSELVTSAYRRSFYQQEGIALASARAGNVIGGGDWAADRLVPDILRAFEKNQPVVIRNPQAIRPWQHVLEPLSGYLMLAERLVIDGQKFAQAWNFGPRDSDAQSVQWIVEKLATMWGGNTAWQIDDSAHPHEAGYLKLDIAKAAGLNWQPRWDLAKALELIVTWHQAWLAGADMQTKCMEQIAQFQRTHTSTLG